MSSKTNIKTVLMTQTLSMFILELQRRKKECYILEHTNLGLLSRMTNARTN